MSVTTKYLKIPFDNDGTPRPDIVVAAEGIATVDQHSNTVCKIHYDDGGLVTLTTESHTDENVRDAIVLQVKKAMADLKSPVASIRTKRYYIVAPTNNIDGVAFA